MIGKLLNKFGYFKPMEITEEDVFQALGRIVGNPTDYEVPKELEDNIFQDLSRVDGITDYLKATMAMDMQRDFAATPDQKDLIHGAFSRTAYLRSRILAAREKS